MARITWRKEQRSFEEVFGKGGIVLTGRNLNPAWLKKVHEQQAEKASREKAKRMKGEGADP
jgi:hypothetical protein